jgi:hypothetical protein
MIKTLGLLAVNAGKNIITALLTKKMALWAIARYVKQTDTQLDDDMYSLFIAGLENQPDEVRVSLQRLTETWLDKENA